MTDDLIRIRSGDWVLQIEDTATGSRGNVRQVVEAGRALLYFGDMVTFEDEGEPVSAFLRILPPGTKVPDGAKLMAINPCGKDHMEKWETFSKYDTRFPYAIVSLPTPEPEPDVPETLTVNGHTYRLDKDNT